MYLARCSVIALALMLATASRAAADVLIVLLDGRISIAARKASITEILDEWARIGHTHVVNHERLADTRITFELENVTEAEALEVILKSSDGYVAVPRAQQIYMQSQFESIVIMARKTTVAAARTTNATENASTPANDPRAANRVAMPVIDEVPLSESESGLADDDGPSFGAIPRVPQRAVEEDVKVPEPISEAPAPVPSPNLPSVPAGSTAPLPGVIVKPPAPRAPPGQ